MYSDYLYPFNSTYLFLNLSGLWVGRQGRHHSGCAWGCGEMAQRRLGQKHVVPRWTEARPEHSLGCHWFGGRGDTTALVAAGDLLHFLSQKAIALLAVQRKEWKNHSKRENTGRRIQARGGHAHSEGNWETLGNHDSQLCHNMGQSEETRRKVNRKRRTGSTCRLINLL